MDKEISQAVIRRMPRYYRYLGDLLDAGVTSFKIEGRLKDTNYIKNVVAYYRRASGDALGLLHPPRNRRLPAGTTLHDELEIHFLTSLSVDS